MVEDEEEREYVGGEKSGGGREMLRKIWKPQEG
jgi:hypothetical protein